MTGQGAVLKLIGVESVAVAKTILVLIGGRQAQAHIRRRPVDSERSTRPICQHLRHKL